MNDIEREITRIITAILMELNSAKVGDDLSRDVQINGRWYKISLTNEADFMLYREHDDPQSYTPLAMAYNGVDDVSEAIDVISRRIEIDR